MNAHSIEIFDGADDDHIVFVIAHDLQLELFPSKDGLFDQNFVHRRDVEAHLDDIFEVFRPKGKVAAAAAQGA